MRRSSQIRITSGSLSGRLIDTPDTTATQPMGERERLAIFNQLQGKLDGATVLDAFAGSGSLGLTALSNGARSADFLEKHPKAIRTIRDNLTKLNLTQSGQIIRKPRVQYDIIFADPPYQKPQYSLIEQLLEYLKPDGLLVLSHPAAPLPPDFTGIAIVSDRKYAAAHIKIYQKI